MLSSGQIKVSMNGARNIRWGAITTPPDLDPHRPSDPETRSMILVDNVVSFFLLAAGGLRVASCCCVFSSGAATATALSLASGRIASVAVFAALRILSVQLTSMDRDRL